MSQGRENGYARFPLSTPIDNLSELGVGGNLYLRYLRYLSFMLLMGALLSLGGAFFLSFPLLLLLLLGITMGLLRRAMMPPHSHCVLQQP